MYRHLATGKRGDERDRGLQRKTGKSARRFIIPSQINLKLKSERKLKQSNIERYFFNERWENAFTKICCAMLFFSGVITGNFFFDLFSHVSVIAKELQAQIAHDLHSAQ